VDLDRSHTPRQPTLSVIILWRERSEGIEECLRSVSSQVHEVNGEIIVVTALEASVDLPARDSSAGPLWVRIEPPLTEARAWEMGLAEARGKTVAFGDARCRYALGWAESVCAARIGANDTATGPVVPADGTSLAGRAAYLCDYAPFSDPSQPSGRRAASNNIAFDRRALCGLGPGRSLEKTELLAHDGFRVVWVPGMRVTTRPVARPWTDLLSRFHRGRHYSAIRASSWSKAFRVVAGLACMALPALLYVRLIGNRSLRSRFAGTLMLGLPWIASALAAWSLGEMSGYWGLGPRIVSAER
jgi:hypothetical protein